MFLLVRVIVSCVPFCQCEKEGKASDYGASKPEGKNILKYVLEYEEGQHTHTRQHTSTDDEECTVIARKRYYLINLVNC